MRTSVPWRNLARAAILLLASADVASAQPSGGMTDNELYAAYCKGVTDQQLNRLTDPVSRGIAAQENKRFTDYLLSTGVMTDLQRTDGLGLLTAIARGKGDHQQCMLNFGVCDQRAADLLHQNKISMSQWQTMLGRCFDSTECVRSRRCGGPDKLPF